MEVELDPPPLVCCECGVRSDGDARRWRAVLAGGVVEGVDIGELEAGVYCTSCAASEFGGRSERC